MKTEALLVLVLAACNGGGNATPDAAGVVADAIDDAPVVTGLVTITARTQVGDGAVDPTAVVIFTSPAGSVLTTMMADANGQASATVPAGSDVTVLQVTTDPTNLAHQREHLTTIRAVMPGDQLVAGRAKDPNYKAGATDNMTATWTPLQAAAEPSLLAVCLDGGPNGTSTGPLNLTFHASCTTPTFDLLMIQPDMASVANYIWVTGQAHSAGGSFAIPNTWAPLAQMSTMVVDSSGTHLAASIELSQVIDGVAMGVEGAAMPMMHDPVTLHYAPIAVPTQLEVIQGGFPPATMHRWVALTTGTPAIAQIDLGAQPLPNVTHVVQDDTSVTWNQSGSGSADARVVFWAASWTDANAIQHDAQWEILEPPTGTSTHVFALPSAYAADDPAASGAQVQGSSVTYVDYDTITSYDAVRAAGVAIGDVESYAHATDHVAHSAVTPSFQPP